jgi:hypothetical protein
MKQLINLKSFLVLLITAFTFTACVDQDFDDIQTANVDPNLTPTHTIRQLQALATGSVGVEITDDIIIAGVVVGDDSSGNIYKKLILQQDSSGIAINLDKTSFYTEYRVGRRVYVKCKGLYIADNGGNFELGNSASNPVGRIPWGLVGQYLFKGQWGQYIAPKVYDLSASTNATDIPTNTLVQFNNVEFVTPHVVWATTGSQNLDIQECGINPATLVIYSSTYSTFALQQVPTGNGSIVGVYTVYNNAGELQIRDPRDANMTGTRCNGGSGNLSLMQLDSIRMMDTQPGTGVYALPIDKKIHVTVTSDYTTNMLTGKNCYVQDATAGIQIRFSATHNFAKGTVLDIDVSGAELSTFAGVLQLNNIPLQNAAPVGVNPATPRTVTITDINTNYNTWESQLVKIDSVTISGPFPTYGIPVGQTGQIILTDATSNTIQLFSSSFSTFANDPYPTGTVSVTGILSEYNGVKEILIRNINDVQ